MKQYTSPRITVAGSLTALTRQGGGDVEVGSMVFPPLEPNPGDTV